MMPPHPDTVRDLQHPRYQELLAEAARERRADEAAHGIPAPTPAARCRAALRQMAAWLVTVTLMTRPRGTPASAWR